MDVEKMDLPSQIEGYWTGLDETKALDDLETLITFYDKWASCYDGVNDHDSACVAMNQQAASMLAESIDVKSASVIEFSCGTGRTGLFLNKAGFQTIDGFDGSEKMLAQSREKGVYRNLVQGLLTSKDLDVLDNNAYDGAICIAGMSPMSVAVKDFLREIVRILKPGGVAVYSVFAGNQLGKKYDPNCVNFMEDHAVFMKAKKIDVISMQRIPYYEMFGTMTYGYLFKTIVL